LARKIRATAVHATKVLEGRHITNYLSDVAKERNHSHQRRLSIKDTHNSAFEPLPDQERSATLDLSGTLPLPTPAQHRNCTDLREPNRPKVLGKLNLCKAEGIMAKKGSPKQATSAPFAGVGESTGTKVWRIEDMKPVPVSAAHHGLFYSG